MADAERRLEDLVKKISDDEDWDEPKKEKPIWLRKRDDGFGHFDFFQLAQDIGAAPNNGFSHNDEVETASIIPFVREFANSTMARQEPFELKYGNEDCGKTYYRGNYIVFYNAIKKAYPDIKIISNCDGSSHPADFHIYTCASSLFYMYHHFERSGPKAFVAVTGKDAGTGSLLAALAEAAFHIGLEKNSDIVEMASYAPLFVNTNDRRWNPDAIVFNSSHLYATPSYCVQRFFAESLLKGNSSSLVASAISWQNNGNDYIRIREALNFEASSVNVKVLVTGLDPNVMKVSGSKKTILTSTNVMDENSFTQPEKVMPHEILLEMAEEDLTVVLPPHSFSSFDLLKESAKIRMPTVEGGDEQR